jgi:hypothetical protein
MIEDKLTRPERIRLEAFSQALSTAGHIFAKRPDLQEIFSLTEKIEAFLRKARDDA